MKKSVSKKENVSGRWCMSNVVNKQTHRYREKMNGCQSGEEQGRDKNGEEEQNYKPPNIKKISHGDVIYNIGKIGNIIIITSYGYRQLPDLL